MSLLPTKCELACSGISLISSQLLLLLGAGLIASVYVSFDVNNEDDVILLHEKLSESIELYQAICVIAWISFPVTLISLYGVTRFLEFIVKGTCGQLIVYVMEKAYILYSFTYVIIPAVLLTIVSYDWKLKESQLDGGVEPGFYVQLGWTIFHLQLSDSMFIADATFVVPTFIVLRYIIWKSFHSHNSAYKQLYDFMTPQCGNESFRICCRECMVIGTGIIVLSIFVVSLCEFSQSGLFAPDSYFKYIFVIVVVVKVVMGIQLIWLARGDRLKRIKKMFRNRNSDHDTQSMMKGQIQLKVEDEHSTPFIEHSEEQFPNTK